MSPRQLIRLWPRNIWYRLAICWTVLWAVGMTVAVLLAPWFVAVGLAPGGVYPLLWLWMGYVNRELWREVARMEGR